MAVEKISVLYPRGKVRKAVKLKTRVFNKKYITLDFCFTRNNGYLKNINYS